MQPDPQVVPHVPQNPLDKPGEPTLYDQIPPWAAPPYFPSEAPTSGGKCEGNACLGSIENASQGAEKQAKDNAALLAAILQALQVIMQMLDLSLLVTINNKLGPQISGGISGKLLTIEGLVNGVRNVVNQVQEKLGKVAKWLQLDRALNWLILATTLHNAVMLARGIGDTVMSVVSNVLAAVGIKDDEGNALDIADIVGDTVEGLIKKMIGTENYTNLSATWKKASRIYQASANLLNNIQSLRYSITSALETIGGWNAKIGNALKRFGVVGDSAYPWMNPNPDFDNKYMRGLETVQNAVSSVDQIASDVLSAQESVNEIVKQKDELQKLLTEGTEKPSVQNQQQQQKSDASKTASASPDINSVDFIKPSN
jgi:hypothetical protein